MGGASRHAGVRVLTPSPKLFRMRVVTTPKGANPRRTSELKSGTIRVRVAILHLVTEEGFIGLSELAGFFGTESRHHMVDANYLSAWSPKRAGGTAARTSTGSSRRLNSGWGHRRPHARLGDLPALPADPRHQPRLAKDECIGIRPGCRAGSHGPGGSLHRPPLSVHVRRLGCSGRQDVDPGVLADFPAAAVLEAAQRGVGHQEEDGRKRQGAGLQSVGDRAGGVVADDLAPNEERSVAGLDSEGVVVVLPEDVREDEDAPRRRCQLSGFGRCLVEAPERCLYFAVQALRAGRDGRSWARRDRREDGQNQNVPSVGLSHEADACGSIAPILSERPAQVKPASLVALMCQVNQQLAYFDERIAALAQTDERVRRRQSVANVGPVTAAASWSPSTRPSAPTACMRSKRTRRPRPSRTEHL